MGWNHINYNLISLIAESDKINSISIFFSIPKIKQNLEVLGEGPVPKTKKVKVVILVPVLIAGPPNFYPIYPI